MFKIHPMNEKQLPSYPLRMPPEVREQVEAAAKSSGRSMNAEIVARLQESFAAPTTEQLTNMAMYNKLKRDLYKDLLETLKPSK